MQRKYKGICTGTVVIQPQRNIRLSQSGTTAYSKWTLSFVPANPFITYGRPDSSNLIFRMSHIDKLKIREVQLNSLSSERPSLLLETHFQHRRRSTTDLQVLSLIHIITCLQKLKIEKQTNQRQNQSQTGLERGKKTNANLISTINLLFFIYTG